MKTLKLAHVDDDADHLYITVEKYEELKDNILSNWFHANYLVGYLLSKEDA